MVEVRPFRVHLGSYGRYRGDVPETDVRDDGAASSRTEVGTWHPVLGTVLEVQTTAPDLATIERAEAAVLACIDELEDVFSIHREHSELARWRRGEPIEPGAALRDVLGHTVRWFARGGGAYNPAVGRLIARWRTAEAAGVEPSAEELAREAEAIASLPFVVRDGVIVRTGDCAPVELHAIAKGWIVDRACDAARAIDGVGRVVVNLGGDLRHVGPGSVRVAIEDPHAPYDNAPPLTTVTIRDAGLATSGSARRGFRVGGRWYGHVLDPRTGRPVDHVASVSVIAPDTMTADVVATIAGVLAVPDALAFVDGLDHLVGRPVGVFIVGADRAQHRNEPWRAHERA